MTPLTAESREDLRLLVNAKKRARLSKARTPHTAPAPKKPVSRVEELERANANLIAHLTRVDADLYEARATAKRLGRQLAVAEKERAHYRRVAETNGFGGWLAAERQIVDLRRQIAEMAA